MDFLNGEWSGAVEPDSLEANGMAIRAMATPILEGCGMMERISAIGQNSAWEVFRVRAYEAERDRWVEYRLDTRWTVLQRLEAEVPAAGAPWVFRAPNPEAAEGETAQWEPRPVIAYAERLGAASQGG
jgi:hypothetical protein